MMIGLEMELNWKTSNNIINASAAKSALDKKAMFLSCSSISPVNLNSTPYQGGN